MNLLPAALHLRAVCLQVLKGQLAVLHPMVVWQVWMVQVLMRLLAALDVRTVSEQAWPGQPAC